MTQSLKVRSTFIFLFFTLLYIIIGINLYVIQIKQHDFYTKIAQQQYHVTITQRPPRGVIMDRTGKNFLAMNCDYVSAFILPMRMTNEKATAQFLQQHFPDAHKRLQKHKDKHFLFIKRRLSSDEQALIANNKTHDICLLSEPGRYYPVPSAGPLIGITNVDNKGLMGIELLYDHLLAGNPTTYHLEKDARSGYYHFKKETSICGDRGKLLQLTIDADLQFLTEQAVRITVEKFKAQSGAAIIMNPDNGEIVSMVSYPHFDPNNTHTASTQLCKNSIITDAYELGSVIKVFAALAALEEGVVTPEELIDCKDTTTTYIDGRKINTVKPHGIISFTDVIAFSNNIGIAIVAKRLDTHLYNHYKKLGFGTKTGIEFPGENCGFVNPPEKWSKQSIISLSYGYEISASILQLACAFCIISTGHTVTPTLLIDRSINPSTSSGRTGEKNSTPRKLSAAFTTESVEESNKIEKNSELNINTEKINSPFAPSLSKGQSNGKQLYSQQNLNIIKNILERTTQYGTTRRAAIKGYRIMTKTGTANMLIDGAYNAEKNLYLCAGIVEKDDYQRVIVTFIKQAEQKNMYAATVAVPLFEEIAERLLIHDTIIS